MDEQEDVFTFFNDDRYHPLLVLAERKVTEEDIDIEMKDQLEENLLFDTSSSTVATSDTTPPSTIATPLNHIATSNSIVATTTTASTASTSSVLLPSILKEGDNFLQYLFEQNPSLLLEAYEQYQQQCSKKISFSTLASVSASVSSSEDPRRQILTELFSDPKVLSSSSKGLPRHYYKRHRTSGTIYNGQLYFPIEEHEKQEMELNFYFSQWNQPSFGGSTDFMNGTIHFPSMMPSIFSSQFALKTISRRKVPSVYFYFIAAELAFQMKNRKPPSSIQMDEPMKEIVQSFLNPSTSSTSTSTTTTTATAAAITARKISFEQIKELLFAWVYVYVFERKEFLETLRYYRNAGYIVHLSQARGGIHLVKK
jgi:hypothetical protein